MKPLGIILAGGLSSRMGGGDKPLKTIDGTTILQRIIDRIEPQCSGLVINANGDPDRFARFGLQVVADTIDGFAGPLAGILAGMDWCSEHHPATETILSVAADCPFLPRDLVERLEGARQTASLPLCAAASGGWTHPVIGLWPISARHALRQELMAGNRKIDRFTPKLGITHAEWPIDPYDPFFNANAPDDISVAEELAVRFPEA